MVGESRLSFSAIWAQFRMVHWPRRYARRSFDRMRLLDFVLDDDLRRRRSFVLWLDDFTDLRPFDLHVQTCDDGVTECLRV